MPDPPPVTEPVVVGPLVSDVDVGPVVTVLDGPVDVLDPPVLLPVEVAVPFVEALLPVLPEPWFHGASVRSGSLEELELEFGGEGVGEADDGKEPEDDEDEPSTGKRPCTRPEAVDDGADWVEERIA